MVVVLVLLVAGCAPAGGQVTVEPYDGRYVSLDLTDSAVVEYALGGDAVAASIRAESAERLGTDADLSNLTNLEGGVFDDQQVGETAATMTTPTAQLQAHDNPYGVFTIQPMDEPQYVRIELPRGAEVSDEDNDTVTYRTGNGTAVSLLLVGEGEVAVEEDNVLARLASESQLVLRVSPNGEDEDFAGQNQLVADGRVLGEVYVIERDPDVVTDTVVYDPGTTVEGSQADESSIDVLVERQVSDGGVVIAGASDSIVPAGEVNVTVDGEPAERADSYDELANALGGDRSRFVVAGPDVTDVTSVAVAIDEFPDSSQRIVVSNGPATADGEDQQDGEGDGQQDGDQQEGDGQQDDGGGVDQPGFGTLAAVIGLLVAALLARWR